MYSINRMRNFRRSIFTLIVVFVLLTSCKSIGSSVSSTETLNNNLFIVFDKTEFEQAKGSDVIYPDTDKIIAYHYKDVSTSFYILCPFLRNATLAIAKEKCAEMNKHGGNAHLINEEDIKVQTKKDILKKISNDDGGGYLKFIVDKVIDDSSVWGNTYEYSVEEGKIIHSVRGRNNRGTGLCISDTELNDISEVPYKTYIDYFKIENYEQWHQPFSDSGSDSGFGVQ